MTEKNVNIADDSGFGALAADERAEKMSRILQDFRQRMSTHSKRVITRIVEMIEEIEPDGNEYIRLKMLASHLIKEGPEFYRISEWPPEGWSAVDAPTTLRAYLAMIQDECNDGVAGWGYLADERSAPHWPAGKLPGQIEEGLHNLCTEVRKHASVEHLGEAAATIELPAVYKAFYEQTNGVYSDNFEKRSFLPSFGGFTPMNALPTEELYTRALPDYHDIAAGWMAGEKMAEDQWTFICYLLCRHQERQAEAWRWRIFVNVSDMQWDCMFENLVDFLEWYSASYDRALWDSVRESIQVSLELIQEENDLYYHEDEAEEEEESGHNEDREKVSKVDD